MSDTPPVRDWLVTFARKVAVERANTAGGRRLAFCVMLNRDEAEGLLSEIQRLMRAADGWTYCPLCGAHEEDGCDCHLDVLAVSAETPDA